MNISLGIYEFYKLSAWVNGICLSVLTVLFVFFANWGTFFFLNFLIGILFIELVTCCLISFVWFSKAERALLNGGARLWTVKRMAPLLFASLACVLVGIYTIFFHTDMQITIIMMLLLTGYLGFALGDMAKIVIRYRRRT